MQDRLNISNKVTSSYFFEAHLLDKWSAMIPVLEKLMGDNDFLKYQSMLEERIQDLVNALAYASYNDSNRDYLEVVAKRSAIEAYKEILSMPKTVYDQLLAMAEYKEGGTNA